ncbi:hypothetical protein [Streptomyces sp. NPDC090445]|uniref:hypothetical protein n=1 Tax=Streptomyces sp. NPDC090445 TaxID=3365963 RepID=UPI00382016D9
MKERLARAEQEVAAARSAFESVSTRAEVSRRVALAAESLLPHSSDQRGQTGASGALASEGEVRTLREELLTLARAHPRITRTEIVGYLGRARPDIKITGLGPELTKLVKAGVLVRVGHATYALPTVAREGDA